MTVVNCKVIWLAASATTVNCSLRALLGSPAASQDIKVAQDLLVAGAEIEDMLAGPGPEGLDEVQAYGAGFPRRQAGKGHSYSYRCDWPGRRSVELDCSLRWS